MRSVVTRSRTRFLTFFFFKDYLHTLSFFLRMQTFKVVFAVLCALLQLLLVLRQSISFLWRGNSETPQKARNNLTKAKHIDLCET